MWSSLHFLKVAQTERCLRSQEVGMTLPSDEDARGRRESLKGQVNQSGDAPKERESSRKTSLEKQRSDSPTMKRNEGDTRGLDMTLPTLGRESASRNGDTKRAGDGPAANPEINAKSRTAATRSGKIKLLGSVGTHNLESWKTIHPENWSNDEVMNWIYNLAEETEQIDVDLLCGEAFRDVTGRKLSRMNRSDFIKLDAHHGPLLYDLFSIINADFAPPDDCNISDTIPFIRELICPGDNEEISDVSFGVYPDSPEPPDSPGSTDGVPGSEEHCLASLSIYNQVYTFDPDDHFDGKIGRDDMDSNQAYYEGSSLRTIGSHLLSEPPSSSGGDTDVVSVISATTCNSSNDYPLHYPDQLSCETSMLNMHPYNGQPEESAAETYEYGSFMQQQQQQQQQQTIDLQHHQSHETVALLKERGYHQDSRTGLFYTFSPDGSRMPKFPGVHRTADETIVDAGRSSPDRNQSGQYLKQVRQEQYSHHGQQHQNKIKGQRRRINKTNNNNAPKATTVKQKQPRKYSKKSTDNDPDRPKSKRGRKKGQLSKDNHLWRFLLDLLKDNTSNPEHIRWENRALGIFTIVNSAHVADLWGKKKKNARMNYEKMSRAIRFCKTPGYIKDAPKDGTYPKKLCYAFGDNTTGWQEPTAGTTGANRGLH